MKKILFIALLSLVTFGAKAYDVLFVNNTHLSSFPCSIIFRWGSTIIPTTVNPGSSSQLFTGLTEDNLNLPVAVATSIACCSPNDQQSSLTTIDNTALPTFSSNPFYLNRCAASSSWTVNIVFFATPNYRFVVTIS